MLSTVFNVAVKFSLKVWWHKGVDLQESLFIFQNSCRSSHNSDDATVLCLQVIHICIRFVDDSYKDVICSRPPESLKFVKWA